MPKLKPEIKSKWVADLRSGEYPQTTGTLHRVVEYDERPVGYCCLGVLALVIGAEEHMTEGAVATDFLFHGNLAKGNIPIKAWRQLFELHEPSYEELTEVDFLIDQFITMNDTRRLSFPAIADWIEENL